jgi:hypothetical protein
MKTARFVGLVVLLASLVTIRFAQIVIGADGWATHRGNNQRTGVTDNSRQSAVKMLLGWTYPFLPFSGETRQPQLRPPKIVDNDDPAHASELDRHLDCARLMRTPCAMRGKKTETPLSRIAMLPGCAGDPTPSLHGKVDLPKQAFTKCSCMCRR